MLGVCIEGVDGVGGTVLLRLIAGEGRGEIGT